MTEQLIQAIDDAITVAAARYDHVLDLLLAEHERLEQLGAMRALAEQLATSSPPALPAAAEPANSTSAGHNGAPACAPIPPDEHLPTPAHTPPAVARPVGHVPQPPARTPAPRAGGTGRDGLTEKQSALVTAVNTLGECSTAEVAKHIGLAAEITAVGSALKNLRERGLVGHNEGRARGARYLSLHRGGSGRQHRSPEEAARADARTRSSLTGSIEQRVELALKWAKTPLKFEAIVTRCKATTVERPQVQEALAYMEADGRAACDDAGRWTKTERLAAAA